MFKFYVKYHAKFLAALSAPVALLSSALADGDVSSGEAKAIGAGFLAALGVFLFPNSDVGTKPPSKANLQAQIDLLSAQVKGLGGTPDA